MSRRASAALTVALAVNGLACADDKPAAEAKKVQPAPDADKQQKPPVVKDGKASRKPGDFDPDLSMPAGTKYDVIRRRDLG